MRRSGARVAPGDRLGAVAPPRPGDRLPAHLHVQLAPADAGVPPGLVPGSLAPAWLAVSPDPGPLLGLTGTTAAGEPAAAVLARRRRAVASPQRLYFPDAPPQIERGWRQWLYDVHGRPYLDLVNNVAVLGHSHPAVEAAAMRQLRRLNTNSRFLYDALGRFAERLAALVPDPLEVVFCVNSGSEAVDLALRLARESTGRRDLVCLTGAYHGWTGATDETMKAPPWVHPVDPPHVDPERSLQQLRTAIERHPPAAFVCEPLLGNWGGTLMPDGWLAAAFALVRAAGGLCIADEVQVGYGRPGRHFWAFEQQRVVPDLVTIAKPAGNGHPLGAVICTRALADELDAREDLFSSPGGGPVSCAIGLAVLDALEGEGLQENARVVGDHLTARLAPLADRFEPVGVLHGMGLYRGLGLSSSAVAFALCERLLELGVLVQPTGPDMDVLKIKPPLCITATATWTSSPTRSRWPSARAGRSGPRGRREAVVARGGPPARAPRDVRRGDHHRPRVLLPVGLPARARAPTARSRRRPRRAGRRWGRRRSTAPRRAPGPRGRTRSRAPARAPATAPGSSRSSRR